MKRLTLVRESPTATEIRGRLEFNGQTLYTIERPWLPTAPGGKPFESCVPAGKYQLILHLRSNGDTVPALINAGLGVCYTRVDRVNGVGRYKVLIHSGNWVDDVVGCIAPGTGRTISNGKPMVTSSRKAMSRIMEYIGDGPAELEIIGSNDYA